MPVPWRPTGTLDAFASYLIAAGVTDLKALTTVMGHSTVTITLDRYGHLLPGSTNRVRDLFDAWAGAPVA
jgi:site-specific recombinase XerD